MCPVHDTEAQIWSGMLKRLSLFSGSCLNSAVFYPLGNLLSAHAHAMQACPASMQITLSGRDGEWVKVHLSENHLHASKDQQLPPPGSVHNHDCY